MLIWQAVDCCVKQCICYRLQTQPKLQKSFNFTLSNSLIYIVTSTLWATRTHTEISGAAIWSSFVLFCQERNIYQSFSFTRFQLLLVRYLSQMTLVAFELIQACFQLILTCVSVAWQSYFHSAARGWDKKGKSPSISLVTMFSRWSITS